LGHSVETLVTTYVGALDGDDVVANRLIDAAMGSTRQWVAQLSDYSRPRPPSDD
jgi:hypothetical protein